MSTMSLVNLCFELLMIRWHGTVVVRQLCEYSSDLLNQLSKVLEFILSRDSLDFSLDRFRKRPIQNIGPKFHNLVFHSDCICDYIIWPLKMRFFSLFEIFYSVNESRNCFCVIVICFSWKGLVVSWWRTLMQTL